MTDANPDGAQINPLLREAPDALVAGYGVPDAGAGEDAPTAPADAPHVAARTEVCRVLARAGGHAADCAFLAFMYDAWRGGELGGWGTLAIMTLAWSTLSAFDVLTTVHTLREWAGREPASAPTREVSCVQGRSPP